MSAPVLKAKWRWDFTPSTWVQEVGTNPLTVTAGRGLVCFTTGYYGTSHSSDLPTDSAGTWTTFTGTDNFGDSAMNMKIAYQLNPTGGSHTFTLPTRTASSDDQLIWIFEDDTLPTSNLVQVTNQKSFDASSAQTWSITSANGVPGLGDRVYAMTLIENSVPQPVENMTNPTGWNQMAVAQDGQENLPSQLCYLDPVTSAALTPQWTCTADNNITNHLSVITGFTKVASNSSLPGSVMQVGGIPYTAFGVCFTYQVSPNS